MTGKDKFSRKKAKPGNLKDNKNDAPHKSESESLNLSDDPDFLSLAAEFDAALEGWKRTQKPDTTSVPAAEPQDDVNLNNKLSDEVLQNGESAGIAPHEAEIEGVAHEPEKTIQMGNKPLQEQSAGSAHPDEAAPCDADSYAGSELTPDTSQSSCSADTEGLLKTDNANYEKTSAPQEEIVSTTAPDDADGTGSHSLEMNEAAVADEDPTDKDEPAASERVKHKSAGSFGSFLRRSKDKDEHKEATTEVAVERPGKVAYLGTVCTAEPTVLSRVFSLLSLGAFFVLTAIFLVQVLPALQYERLLWFSDELRQADILSGVFDGNWLQIYLNGEIYQEAPPLYFWFLFIVHKLLLFAGIDLGTDYAKLLFVGAAISGILFIWSGYVLARSTAHLDRRGSFAAGCILLSVLFLQFFFHYSSLDLFFAAFIVLSHVFLFKALMRPHAPFLMGLAFFCAAIALMTKGAVGITLPVLTAVLFCLWSGRPQRLFKADFLLGIAFALLPVVIWLGSIWASGQHDVVIQMLKEQVWLKAFGDAHHKEAWWYYLLVLPAMWLPWSLLIFVIPWQNIFKRSTWQAIKSARNGERQGLAFVWIFFIGSFILISLLQHKQPVYLVPLMPALAVMSGRAVLQLSPLRSIVLQRLMAALFFLLAIVFVLLPVYYSGDIPDMFAWLEWLNLPAWDVKINGIFFLALVMLINTCLLIGVVKGRRPESTLLVLVLGALLFSYPMSTMSMPSLDSVVSSKDASVELRRYADIGYYPVSFKVYPGVFSYYSGITINETSNWTELERILALQPRTVVAMGANRWAEWTQNPGFTEVMRFWMLSGEYVLLLRNSEADIIFGPAEAEEKDAPDHLEDIKQPETGHEMPGVNADVDDVYDDALDEAETPATDNSYGGTAAPLSSDNLQGQGGEAKDVTQEKSADNHDTVVDTTNGSSDTPEVGSILLDETDDASANSDGDTANVSNYSSESGTSGTVLPENIDEIHTEIGDEGAQSFSSDDAEAADILNDNGDKTASDDLDAETSGNDSDPEPLEPSEIPDGTLLLDEPTPHDPFSPIHLE